MQLLSITLGPYNIAETRVHVHAQLRTIASIAHGELEFVLTGVHVPLPSFARISHLCMRAEPYFSVVASEGNGCG